MNKNTTVETLTKSARFYYNLYLCQYFSGPIYKAIVKDKEENQLFERVAKQYRHAFLYGKEVKLTGSFAQPIRDYERHLNEMGIKSYHLRAFASLYFTYDKQLFQMFEREQDISRFGATDRTMAKFKKFLFGNLDDIYNDAIAGNAWWTRMTPEGLRTQLCNKRLIMNEYDVNTLGQKYISNDFDWNIDVEGNRTSRRDLIAKLDENMRKQGVTPYFEKYVRENGEIKTYLTDQKPKENYYRIVYASFEEYLKRQEPTEYIKM